MIPTGNKKENKKNHEWINGEEILHPLFFPLALFPPLSFLSVIILSIRSEEVLLFLELLIHINTYNRMEINS